MEESRPDDWVVDDLNLAISLRGYLVIGSDSEEEVGSLMPAFQHDGQWISNPFRIIAKTDRADFEEQARTAWPEDFSMLGSWTHYYRCIND